MPKMLQKFLAVLPDYSEILRILMRMLKVLRDFLPNPQIFPKNVTVLARFFAK